VKNLSDVVPQLLWKKRAGVVLALVNAALRNKAGQKRLGNVLTSTIQEQVSSVGTWDPKKVKRSLGPICWVSGH
jgi:hypothetical protein